MRNKNWRYTFKKLLIGFEAGKIDIDQIERFVEFLIDRAESEVNVEAEVMQKIGGHKKPRELFEIYSKGENWKNVIKTHENLFVIGAEAAMIRAGEMLHSFFNHKSDANKFLEASQQENLEKEFAEFIQLNLH